ncbi:MAG: ribosome biogenesis GTPase Der [Deltaproteobacteria bacterium]|nr:MAG: ribosome biogenesis GTPase Der [Deltaproteobacteria bacterium]
MSLPVVAIVGRPNVGKSTLFNRIIGFHKAVVHDRPGVTRDRLYELAEAHGRRFMLIDTGGLEPRPDTTLLQAMRGQVLIALDEADVIVFVVDARAGFTPADLEVADLLRRTDKAVVLAVNKVDGPSHEDLAADFWQVGIDELFTFSAAHGRGMWELLDAVVSRLPERTAAEDDEDFDDPDALLPQDLPAILPESPSELLDGESEAPTQAPLPHELRIAVIGRPNIGKSTLVNRLLGEARHLVHDMPGTTMDPIDSPVEIDGQRYLLVDTAGVRRKSKIDDRLERSVSLRSIRSIERCHVALLVVDATEGLTTQDAKLAELVIDRGRALIVLINKWDLTPDLEEVNSRSIEEELRIKLPHAMWAPHLFISAKTGKGVHRILPMVHRVFSSFNTRLSTGRLNRFLLDAVNAHTVPQRYHRPVRLYFATQARVRPPTFVFWSNTPEGVPESYKRYLQNNLREQFDFEGTPLKLHFRQRRKPGAPKD